MTDARIAAALTSILSLAGILLLLRLYRDYSVDRFRQDLFALRDEMFDYAASGGVEFRHPAYGLLRLTMNGFVRRADGLHLLRVVLLLLASPREDRRGGGGLPAAWRRSLLDLDSHGQARMNDYRDRMRRIVAPYLLFRSPVMLATIIVPVVAASMGVTLTNFALRVLPNRWLDDLDAAAFEYGAARSTDEALPASKIAAPA